MKAINTKRWLSVLLVLCMAASLFVTPALAAQDVDATPGSGKIPVEYFTSTLYKWDEAKANAATMDADKTGGYTETYVKYSEVASQYSPDYTATSYFYQVGNEYYPVYYTRTYQYSFPVGYTNYKLYYKIGNNFENFSRSTSGNDRVNLYTSTAGYEGKGFYFTEEANNKPEDQYIPAFSKWDGTEDSSGNAMQQYSYYSGIAADRLSESTNAPFSNSVNAAELFATDGSNTGYTSVYTDVQVPFVYEDGYYELNSDKNAVYFANDNVASNAKMNIADKPAAFQYEGSYGKGYYAGFQPFNTLNSWDNVQAFLGNEPEQQTEPAYAINGDTTYGFGMVTTVNFQMTDDGKTDGKNGREDIIFEFSGDDDVWVYVDGVLALDIGGTHDAIQGTINFATGDVTVRSEKYGKIRDKNEEGAGHETTTGSYTQWDIYEKLDTTRTGFASEGNHTLTVYYMDRGRGLTNCQIRFNLPQRDSVSVTKNVSEYYTGMNTKIPDEVKNTQFTFQLLNNNTPVSYQAYTLYDASNEIKGSGTTSGNGTFTLTNGQRAVFQNISLDERQTWQVIETSPGDLWTASWEATSSVTTATIGSPNGMTSGLVTVQGSDTASDSISFVCTNSYRYVTDVNLNVRNESVVIDYGLPVEVDVLANDSVTGNGEITGFKITSQGQYGTAINDSGKLVYTLNQMLSTIDTVSYTVYAKDNTNEEVVYKTGTLTIIPATSMYYEESFGPQEGNNRAIIYQTNNGRWTPTSDDNTYGTYQETALVGGSSSTYGTDPVYLNNLGDSYGTSRKADVTEGAAQIQYDFTGTGTAIYGKITPNSAYIMVEITNKETNKVVDKQYIDTVVLTGTEGSGNLTTLYNIPIYNNDQLEYGSYHVRVYIYKAGTPTTHGKSGSEFYLDGIRVYCPLGDQSSEAFPTVADEAYSGHGEANVVTANIRYKLINDGSEGDTFATLTDINGGITDLAQYGEIGPNEELYLKEDYSVTFAIKNWNSQQYKMFLGMKAPDGKANVSVRVGSQTYSIGNSVDCYYDISKNIVTDTDGVSYVTITGDSGLVSLTNIKVTGTDEYKIVTSGEDIGPADPNMLTFMSVDLASSVNGSTEPPVEETPVFEPDRVKTSCVYSRLLRVATVTVTTSKDVDYVTINGRTVKGVSLFGSTYFTRACTGISKGEEIEIVCYNSDGVASQTYTVTAK